MRRRGPPKQRVRLGPDRYLRCGRRNYTVADADTHGYSDGYGYGDHYAATDANTQVGAVAKGASHASAEAVVFTYRKFPFRGP